MHPNLKELEIEAPNAVEAFADDKPSNCRPGASDGDTSGAVRKPRAYTSGFKHRNAEVVADTDSPAKRSKLGEDSSDLALSDVWDAIKAFPALETLSLRSEGLNVKKHSLTRFPPSLTKFKICARSTTLDWSALPRSLESLSFDLDLDLSKPIALQQFPPNLKYVSFHRNGIHIAKVLKSKPLLLPHLTELDIISKENYYELKCVKHISWTPPSSKELPSHIESLRCQTAFPSMMPSSLTTITAEHLDLSEGIKCVVMPPTLTQLTVLSGTFNPQYFHLLPRGLKFLSLSTSARYGEPVAEESILLCNGASSLAKADAEAWRVAKEFILTSHSHATSYVKAYFDRVESGGLYGLPISLTHLQISKIPWSKQYKLCLPPKLMQVSSNAYSDPDLDPFFIDMLSPSLQSLALSRDLTNWALPSLSIAHQLGFNMPWLCTVVIDLRPTATADFVQLIPLLPRSLLALSLTQYDHIMSVEALAQLPPKLDFLAICCMCVSTPSQWLGVLPRTLKKLSLSKIVVFAPDLLQLPPKLADFSGDVSHFTLDILYSLPRSLSKFNAQPPFTRDLKSAGALVNADAWKFLLETCRPFWRIFNIPRDLVDLSLRPEFRPSWSIVPPRDHFEAQ